MYLNFSTTQPPDLSRPVFLSSSARRWRALTKDQAVLYQKLYAKRSVINHPDILDAAQLKKARLVLEIGFGDGANLVALATKFPETYFIGAELYRPGLLKIAKLADQLNLNNLFLFEGDARHLLSKLPDNVLAGCVILFPDPWPKQRHHKRRLVDAAFLTLLHSKCCANAEFNLATDCHDYALAVHKLLTSSLTTTWAPNPNLAAFKRCVATKFALKSTLKFDELCFVVCK